MVNNKKGQEGWKSSLAPQEESKLKDKARGAATEEQRDTAAKGDKTVNGRRDNHDNHGRK